MPTRPSRALAPFLIAFLFWAPSVSHANETGHWEDDPLWQLPVANPLGLGVGWDRGLVIGFDDPLRIRGRFGATADFDFGVEDTPTNDGFDREIRRFRFYAQGRLYALGDPAFRFRFAFEEDQVQLNDFYLRWLYGNRFFDSVLIGYFRPPGGLAAQESSRAQGLMESSSAATAFEPAYRFGAQVSGFHENPDLTWQVALTTRGQNDQIEGDASDSLLRLNTRFVWRPVFQDAGPQSVRHVGLTLGYSASGSTEIRFRSRPETILIDYLVDTGDIDGDYSIISLEGAWREGPLRIFAEAYRTFVDSPGEDANFGGVYVEVGRMLTGEIRPYNRAQAAFGRVHPNNPFSWKNKSWGALEATGRLSWVDLDDSGIRGGRMITANAGLVLTANEFVRVHLNGIVAYVNRGSWRHVGVLQSRLEVRF